MWRRAGVQMRSAVAAIALLAVLIAVGSLGLVLMLEDSLVNGLDRTGRAVAEGIAAQVPDAGLTARSAGRSADLSAALDAADERKGTTVQVIGPKGDVIAGTRDARGRPAMVDLRPRPGKLKAQDVRAGVVDDDPLRVVALGGSIEGKRFTVLVGQSAESLQKSVSKVVKLLGVAVPLLLLAVGLATFVFVGRSLRPVEAIRRSVARIGDRDLSERVPVPPGEDPVAKLASTMNAMLARLESSQRAQRQFVADASHELRSPIATLRVGADVALTHPDPDSLAFPAAVLEETQRLERLVADLLVLARADERGLRVEARDVDLDDIMSAERRRLLATTGLDVQANLQPVRVSGDPHQLSRVVRNLVDNAAQHARSRVELTVAAVDGRAVLEVANDGPPIPEAERERIFERFVRLDDSRNRGTGGTGLGLAIVRELVAAHGGTVEVVPATAPRVMMLAGQGALRRHGVAVGPHGAGRNVAGENGAGEHGAGEHGAAENGAGENGAGENGAGQHRGDRSVGAENGTGTETRFRVRLPLG